MLNLGGKGMASLHYIYAPMNASKSAQLLMAAHNYEERGYNVLIVKPGTDTRDGAFIQSRALDIVREVDQVVSPEDKYAIYEKAYHKLPSVILVDEAQFLTPEQVDELGEIVDLLEIPVMAYGLKTDAFTKLFPGSQRLLEIADKFQEIKTICPCCGKKAVINMRLDADENPVFDGEQVSPGNHYISVCRKYYQKLKKMNIQSNM